MMTPAEARQLVQAGIKAGRIHSPAHIPDVTTRDTPRQRAWGPGRKILSEEEARRRQRERVFRNNRRRRARFKALGLTVRGNPRKVSHERTNNVEVQQVR